MSEKSSRGGGGGGGGGGGKDAGGGGRGVGLGERSVRAIGPCEDVREAPGSDLGFGFFAGGRRRHCVVFVGGESELGGVD